ncbi:MAG: hypothetical protein Q8L14_35920, partial [Myxococcales bacterium]|nr:hypothetical protein [Myxococcales bacterium]
LGVRTDTDLPEPAAVESLPLAGCTFVITGTLGRSRDEIKVDLENLKKQLNTADPEKIRPAIKQLEGSAYRIADAIYAAESGGAEAKK